MSENLFPIISNSKYGFINDKGEIIIGFDFFHARNFSEGLAAVGINGKFGFIDTKGNVVIPPKFDNVRDFHHGLAVVKFENKYGYIDKTGELVIDKTGFHNCADFVNGLAHVMENVLSKGNFIDKTGTLKFSNRDFLRSKYSEGLINCAGEKGWGFIDIHDNFVIPPVYKFTAPFYESKAAVIPKKDKVGNSNKANLYGFINPQNEMIIDPLYDGVDMEFSEGRCRIFDGTNYGFINEKGEVIIPCTHSLVDNFSEGMAAFQRKNLNYGFLDKEGNIKIKAIFTYADPFHNGLAHVMVGQEPKDYRYGYINVNGDYIWEPTI
jgi:hypothetical protein